MNVALAQVTHLGFFLEISLVPRRPCRSTAIPHSPLGRSLVPPAAEPIAQSRKPMYINGFRPFHFSAYWPG